MAILIDKNTKVIVQGITGNQGRFHTAYMSEYGTNIVAGTSPGKAGEDVNGIPVFDSVLDAKKAEGGNASIIFVPARFALDAALEAIAAGLNLLVMITEGIPLQDEIFIIDYAKREKINIIGPNTPGIISPSLSKLGIMPNHIFREGEIGLISRSGTLTYEIAAALTHARLGQSTCLGIGGDPVTGVGFIDALKLFQTDASTEAIVLVGEIGGNQEEQAAEFIRESMNKPVIAYIGGRTAPAGKRMGHAGAIISGTEGTAQSKIKAFQEAGVITADKPSEIPRLIKKVK